jgi:hypothetical protein
LASSSLVTRMLGPSQASFFPACRAALPSRQASVSPGYETIFSQAARCFFRYSTGSSLVLVSSIV